MRQVQASWRHRSVELVALVVIALISHRTCEETRGGRRGTSGVWTNESLSRITEGDRKERMSFCRWCFGWRDGRHLARSSTGGFIPASNQTVSFQEFRCHDVGRPRTRTPSDKLEFVRFQAAPAVNAKHVTERTSMSSLVPNTPRHSVRSFHVLDVKDRRSSNMSSNAAKRMRVVRSSRNAYVSQRE